MTPLEEAALLMTLLRRSAQTLTAERQLLAELPLDRLRQLQGDHTKLTAAVGAQLDRVRRSPERLVEIGDRARVTLEDAIRSEQEETALNRALATAVREELLPCLDRAAQRGHHGPVRSGGRVVPFEPAQRPRHQGRRS